MLASIQKCPNRRLVFNLSQQVSLTHIPLKFSPCYPLTFNLAVYFSTYYVSSLSNLFLTPTSKQKKTQMEQENVPNNRANKGKQIFQSLIDLVKKKENGP